MSCIITYNGQNFTQEDFLDYLKSQIPLSQSTTITPTEFINHSGGAKGGDTVWDQVGREFGVTNHNHYTVTYYDTLIQKEKNQLQEQYISTVNFLKRGVIGADTYSGKLVRRDMIQANNGDAIFGITELVKPNTKGRKGYVNKTNYSIPEGGTGYAVARGILLNKPTYVFNQSDSYGNEIGWYVWDNSVKDFVKTDTPTLTNNFTGIGSQEINDLGKQAIRDVYEKTFKSQENKSVVEFNQPTDQIEAGDHFNFQDSETLLQSVVNHPTVPQYLKDLAKQLLDKISVKNINMETYAGNSKSVGTYNNTTNTVTINLRQFRENKTSTVERISETIVHEYIHAATVKGLKEFKAGLNNNVHLKNINTLFEQYRKDLIQEAGYQEFLRYLEKVKTKQDLTIAERQKGKELQNKYYAAYKVEEFITMGLSNPTTRETLKSKNLLQKLFDSIASFLGLDNNMFTLLEQEYEKYLDSVNNNKQTFQEDNISDLDTYQYYGKTYQIHTVPQKETVTIKPQTSEYISNKTTSSLDKYGYVDVLDKNNTDFKLALIKYIVKQLDPSVKTDTQVNAYIVKEKKEGRPFDLKKYVTLEELGDKTRVKLNLSGIIQDEVEDTGPISLEGLNFTSSGQDNNAQDVFKNNINEAFNCK